MARIICYKYRLLHELLFQHFKSTGKNLCWRNANVPVHRCTNYRAVATLNSTPSVQERRVAAVVGCVVADAAAQPLHWVYSDEELKSLIGGDEEIEFRSPSGNPFYKVPTGRNSSYGDLAVAMLKSLVANEGLSKTHLTEELYQTFGPDSEYGKLELDIDRKPPIDRPWRNAAIREFLQNVIEKKEETGSPTDMQIDCVVHIIPLVALYAGHPDLTKKVAEAVSVTQANELAIAYSLAAARVLEQYILHKDPNDVLHSVIQDTNSSLNPMPLPSDKNVEQDLIIVKELLPKSCYDVVPAHFKKN